MVELPKITELPEKPWEIDQDLYNKLNFQHIVSDMGDIERRMIHGLIRYYNPQHILELGVHHGGGTCNILNAISDDPNAELISIDIVTEKIFPGLGKYAKELFAHSIDSKWNFYTGLDPCEVLDSCNKMFDFVVIDTAHFHPVESLNFLTILPYLKDGAIVVLHDIETVYFSPPQSAPRILWSSVAAPKITHDKAYFLSNIPQEIINIGAFQITPDTRTNICNVFYGLALPWETTNLRFDALTNYFNKHYEDDLCKIWRRVYGAALIRKLTNNIFWDEKLLAACFIKLQKMPNKPIFYGAGRRMTNILRILKQLNIDFDFTILDKKADKILSIEGHKVIYPDFNKTVSKQMIVVAVDDTEIVREICETFVPLGYETIHYIAFFEKLLNQFQLRDSGS